MKTLQEWMAENEKLCQEANKAERMLGVVSACIDTSKALPTALKIIRELVERMNQPGFCSRRQAELVAEAIINEQK